MSGARRVAAVTPRFDDFRLGDVHVSYRRTVTETHLVQFTALAGLQLPQFIDQDQAREGPFGERIAPGFLTASLSAGMLESVLGTNTLAGLGMDRFRFTRPVLIGDTLAAEVRVLDKKDTRDPARGILTVAVSVINQRGQNVLDYETTVLMSK